MTAKVVGVVALVALVLAGLAAYGFFWFKSVGYDPRCLVVQCRIVKK